MMPPLVKVSSPSFSRNPILQRELERRPFRSILNTEARALPGLALADYLSDADGAILGLDKVSEAVLEKCPKLRVIAKFGVGTDNIDMEACARRGIEVFCATGVNRRSVAELTLGTMLCLSHNVFLTMQQLKLGKWNKEGGRELSGKTVGIIGLGHIGKELVTLLRPFGCRIIGRDVSDISEFARLHDITLVSMDEIFRTADFVTLHVPFTESLRHLINEETLSLFRPTSFLINTSRGQIVDQEALKRALKAGKLMGAALDVYESEPPTDMEFLQLPNLVCTPHISGIAFEAVVATGMKAIDNLEAFFRSHITHSNIRE